MQQVKILRYAPPPVPSPYAGRAVAGPLHIAQTSPKKSKAIQKSPVRNAEEVPPVTPETEQDLSNEGPSSLGK